MKGVVGALVLLVAVLAIVLLVVAAAGAMVGLFFGALLCAIEALAGPCGPTADAMSAWWALALIALLLAADVARPWGRGRRTRGRP